MTKPSLQITLRVSELSAWKRAYGANNKRVWPGPLARALRKNAGCSASIQVQSGVFDRARTNEIVAALKRLTLVRDVDVFIRGDTQQLVVRSKQGLVTERDRRRFATQVQLFLAVSLLATVRVEYYHTLARS